MKGLKWTLALVLAMGAMLPTVASAGGHWRGSVGVYIGGPGPYYGPAPYYGPYYAYPPPYYVYSPPPVIVHESPPVYVERDEGEAAPPRSKNYWYYCDRPSGYYPYVKECPGGWQRVAPTPPR